MAAAQFIAPFPAEIDRRDFGHYLSGFVDGEGCFHLLTRRSGVRVFLVKFTIGLRADDGLILRQMQSYWRCGIIYHAKVGPRNPHPILSYRVERLVDVATVLVPHFDSYPLRAKKAGDYAFWREAALMAYQISRRPFPRTPGVKGNAPKWDEREAERFLALDAAINAHRRYRASL